jgi:RNA polymerase sigma-70 factor (ECF subfamily)
LTGWSNVVSVLRMRISMTRPLCDSVPAGEPAADDVLLRQIRRGDEAALATLYDRYAGFVFAVALRIVGDRDLAEEILQDTFLRCWHGIETYQPERGRVAGWLAGIARHRAIDLLRGRQHQARLRERDTLSEAAQRPAPETTDLMLLREAVNAALAELTTGERHVLELAYYGGLTQTEIARQVGQPLGTVKTRTRAALDRLRTTLRPYFAPGADGE